MLSGNKVVAEYRYDPWGGRLDPATRTYYAPGEEPELMFGRGYTGHEHLPEYGLIHMNARLYDPQTGRFLSPDPYVQDPANTQSYNRYAYALNNPLRYIDPSGELVYDDKGYYYDYDRRCFVDKNGDRVDFGDAYRYLFSRGHFRGSNTIYGDGRSYWAPPKYAIGGPVGTVSGYTWKYAYTSVSVAEPSLEVWDDGSYILGEVTTVGVMIRYQVPTIELFLNDADNVVGTIGLSIEGLNLGWEHLSAPSRQNLAYHMQQTMRSSGARTTATALKRGIPNTLKNLGKTTSAASVVITVVDVVSSRSIDASNVLSLAVTGVSAIPGVGWAVSVGFMVSDVVVLEVSGQSIGDHLDNAVKGSLFSW